MSRRGAVKMALTPRRYGGVVSVAPVRNRIDPGEDRYSVAYQSRDGAVAWLSQPIGSQDHADAAAATLAEFLGAAVR